MQAFSNVSFGVGKNHTTMDAHHFGWQLEMGTFSRSTKNTANKR
jgi:hypothetical protein